MPEREQALRQYRRRAAARRVREIASKLRTRGKLSRDETTRVIRRATRELASLAEMAAAEAAAVLRNGRRALPKAISGHLTYFLWGPRGYTGEVMIVMDDNRETLEKLFDHVELAGHVSHPYSMPYQHFDVYVCRGPHRPLAEWWPRVKSWG